MKQSREKYISFAPLKMERRDWPDRQLIRAPIWCSVDLRDGNQALMDPMNVEEKLEFFQMLTKIGLKEIEVGFPSASETEREFLRTLIEGNFIPDDVTVQVLVQARDHLIEQTFEAIDGAKNVIFHFYNNVSPLHRKVVFQENMDGIVRIAADAARLIRARGEQAAAKGMNLRYEYSPESFSATETDFAVEVCRRVLEELGATPERRVILNLPSTVENCTPNLFADQIEYFCRNLPGRDRAIISVHPHNDRGTGVATAELAQMAGAERVEGTLFGNGERTGNVDLVTLALNLHTQGIDPGLNFGDINAIRDVYERTTRMRVPERQPYVGNLVFTAFSGSHQDAINKGIHYMKEHDSPLWEVPYLPINPADVGRAYEPIIRINSQSGKGGAAFVMEHNYGYCLPKAMHPDFGTVVQKETDRRGEELSAADIFELFEHEYIQISYPYRLDHYHFEDEQDAGGHSHVTFSGTLYYMDTRYDVAGEGNGPIDAFFQAVGNLKISNFHFISYSAHAITVGSDSKAAAYIHLRAPDGRQVFGVGISHNIYLAPIRGILSAINRVSKK